jgi:hypothetical protein
LSTPPLERLTAFSGDSTKRFGLRQNAVIWLLRLLSETGRKSPWKKEMSHFGNFVTYT